MAKRTISKGSRLRLRDKYDREFFVLITGLLVASPVGFFYKNFETLPPKVLAIYAVGILLIAFSVAFGLLILLYHKFLFFSKKNYKRLLLNYVVKHGLVEKETVKDEKGSHEKLKLAPIYLKQPNTYELHTYFPIDGGVHQEKFLDLADGLETTFLLIIKNKILLMKVKFFLKKHLLSMFLQLTENVIVFQLMMSSSIKS